MERGDVLVTLDNDIHNLANLEFVEGVPKFRCSLKAREVPYIGRRAMVTIKFPVGRTAELAWIIVYDEGVFKGRAAENIENEEGVKIS